MDPSVRWDDDRGVIQTQKRRRPGGMVGGASGSLTGSVLW
jgi:hypothetical protein